MPEDHCLCTIATAEAFHKQALELTQLRTNLHAGKAVVATPFLLHEGVTAQFEIGPTPNSQGAALCCFAGVLHSTQAA